MLCLFLLSFLSYVRLSFLISRPVFRRNDVLRIRYNNFKLYFFFFKNTNTNFESAASTACGSNNKENDPFSTTSHPGIALIDWKDTERTHLPKPVQNMDLEIDLDPISHSSCEDTCVPSTESNKLRALEENSGINKDFMSAAEHVTNDVNIFVVYH